MENNQIKHVELPNELHNDAELHELDDEVDDETDESQDESIQDDDIDEDSGDDLPMLTEDNSQEELKYYESKNNELGNELGNDLNSELGNDLNSELGSDMKNNLTNEELDIIKEYIWLTDFDASVFCAYNYPLQPNELQNRHVSSIISKINTLRQANNTSLNQQDINLINTLYKSYSNEINNIKIRRRDEISREISSEMEIQRLVEQSEQSSSIARQSQRVEQDIAIQDSIERLPSRRAQNTGYDYEEDSLPPLMDNNMSRRDRERFERQVEFKSRHLRNIYVDDIAVEYSADDQNNPVSYTNEVKICITPRSCDYKNRDLEEHSDSGIC